MSDLEDDVAPEQYRYISKPGKLKWKAKPKIGSLEKISHIPGGGNVLLEKNSIRWRRESRIDSLGNINHKPLGGNKTIFDQKPKWEKKSRCGSLDNIHHKPGGGDVDINNVEGSMRWGKWKPLPSIATSRDSLEEWVEEKPKKGSTGFYRTSNTGALEYSTKRPLSRGLEYFTKTEPNPDFDYDAFVKKMEEQNIIEKDDSVLSKKGEARILKPKQSTKDKKIFKVEIKEKEKRTSKLNTSKGAQLKPFDKLNDDHTYNANVPPSHDNLGATTGYSNFLTKNTAEQSRKTQSKHYERDQSPRSEVQTRNSFTPTYGSIYRSTKKSNDNSTLRYRQRSPYLVESMRTRHEVPNMKNPLNRPMGYIPHSVRGKNQTNKLAQSKIGSKDNIYHKPGGGDVQIRTSPILWQGKPRVGSLDNFKHQPGGGKVKIPNHSLGWEKQPRINARLPGFYIEPT